MHTFNILYTGRQSTAIFLSPSPSTIYWEKYHNGNLEISINCSEAAKTAEVICESKQLRTYILLPEGENQWQSTGLLRYAKNHMI